MLQLVAVVGGSLASSKEEEIAYLIGYYHLICGGKGGIMQAVCQGAKESPLKTGMIIGILPGTHRSEANPFIELALPTGLGTYRNSVIAHACDAMIAIGGKAGTLSELSLAWHEKKPIGGLSGCNLLPHPEMPLKHLSSTENALSWLQGAL